MPNFIRVHSENPLWISIILQISSSVSAIRTSYDFAAIDFSHASDVHLYMSIFSIFLPLFNKLQEFLICLKIFMKGLKHDTSKGYRT